MTPQASIDAATADSLSPEAEERLTCILEKCVEEMEQGSPPDVEQLAAAHPDLAEPLKRIWPASGCCTRWEPRCRHSATDRSVALSSEPSSSATSASSARSAEAEWGSCTRPGSSHSTGGWQSRYCRLLPCWIRNKSRGSRARPGPPHNCTIPTSFPCFLSGASAASTIMRCKMLTANRWTS